MTGVSAVHLEGEEAVFSLFAAENALLCFYNVLPTAQEFDSQVVNAIVLPEMHDISVLVAESGLSHKRGPPSNAPYS